MKNTVAAAIAKTIVPFLAVDTDKRKLALALDSVLEEAESDQDRQRGWYGHGADEWKTMSAADRKTARDEWQSKRRAKDVAEGATGNKNFEGAKDELRREMTALFEARAAVRPIVGIVTMDSAEEVYAFGLKHLGVKTDVPPAAYRRLFEVAYSKSAKPAPVFDAAVHEHSIDAIFRSRLP